MRLTHSLRRWRRTATVAVVATAMLSLAACGGSSDDSSSSDSSSDYGDISLQLSWIKNSEFLGEYMADTNGYYKDAGFKKVNLVPGPSTGVAELVSGKADIALSDAISVGTAVAKEKAPVKIIGTTYQKNPFTILSLADKANITSPQDLIGKKIGVQDSNTSLFKALLKANGIDESQVTVVPVQYDASVLTSGKVDGYVAYLTNESIIVANQGYKVANLPFAENGLPFVAETFTATDDTIKNKPKMLKAFLKAEVKGWTDAMADPAKAIDVDLASYGKDLKLDKATELQSATAQNDLISTDDTKSNGLFTITSDLQDETIKSLAAAGLDVKASDLFDTSIIDSLYKDEPGLKDYAK